jgi:hypothetical protein
LDVESLRLDRLEDVGVWRCGVEKHAAEALLGCKPCKPLNCIERTSAAADLNWLICKMHLAGSRASELIHTPLSRDGPAFWWSIRRQDHYTWARKGL